MNRDDDYRPTPEELLGIANAEEETISTGKRGRLKIFFGACAGVGKTYSMLSAAHARIKDGADVMVGLVETHGRTETEKLLEGLPSIPLHETIHRGITIREFDLDAALERKPQIIVLDELAHSNAPGSRHPKRWQDVEELLEAGIDVYTSLNVQHLESLNDVVAKITGVWVRETVPDAVFDKADDISLVDIPSDELLKRLQEGKVYVAAQVKKKAAHNFFRKGNLIALREMALRRTAERVDEQMDLYKQGNTGGTGQNKTVSERIMVCVGPDPLSMKLVRAAKRMATGLKASWVAVYIENDRHYRLSKEGQEAVERTLRLAEQMGGKAEILQGNRAADEIITYARTHDITKIIAGKPQRPRWRDVLFDSLADELVRRSIDIDIHIITGTHAPMAKQKIQTEQLLAPKGYIVAGVILLACSMLSLLLRQVLDPVNVIMLYMVGVVVVAAQFGRWPAIALAVLSVLSFNFFHKPPYFSFSLQDSQYLVTLMVMVVTSVMISAQTSRLRLQYSFSRKREKNTAALYSMTRELASTRGKANIANASTRHMSEVFDSEVIIWTPDENDTLQMISDSNITETGSEPREETVAQWAYDHLQLAGKGTSTLPGSRGLYMPITLSGEAIGVVGVVPRNVSRNFDSEHIQLLETFTGQTAAALERAGIAESAERTKVEAESEKLRNVLLSSISNDLRVPLSTLASAVSGLFSQEGQGVTNMREELMRTITEETSKLSRFVQNLPDEAGLEAGSVKLNKDYHQMTSLIQNAVAFTQERYPQVAIKYDLPNALPLIRVDGLLIEQVLINLLENATHLSSFEYPVRVTMDNTGQELRVQIEENGSYDKNEEEKNFFDRVASVPDKSNLRGSWLGLAIVRGIVRAHGGKFLLENTERGMRFSFTLPMEGMLRFKETSTTSAEE